MEKIINDWKKNKFKPIYFLEGEEDFYIDQLLTYAENEILNESEKAVNLSVFYGKDADWTNVINTCKRHPMFAEKQLVLLKEAQTMNSFDKLESYFESPLFTTIFIIGYKGKTYDKRTKIYKSILKNGEVFKSEKVGDANILDWITQQVAAKSLAITPKAVSLLHEHLGNDLNRIITEIDKLAINLNGKKNIDENDIEKYTGISKEHNIFELQAAIVNKDLTTALKIINYFEANPKASPIQMALPALYAFFSKVHAAYGLSNISESSMKPLFYNSYAAVKQANIMMKNYGFSGAEKIILLLNYYNLKSLGVGDNNTAAAQLLKEMVAKMIL